MRVDNSGNFWETAFDIVSLAVSIVDVCKNPDDAWAWVGLAADAVDLIPFVAGVGETVRAVTAGRKASKAAISAGETIVDGVKIRKATDFTDEAKQLINSLDHTDGVTKSSASIGRDIHKGYKATSEYNPRFKEFDEVKGIRPDYVDFDTNTIYELKPMNPRSIKKGIAQLKKYNEILGGNFKLVLEFY